MIMPFGFQVPPRPAGASASVTTGPPRASIFFSLPPAKNPMDLLSGDQNGYSAPALLPPASVPESCCAVNPLSGLTHKDRSPPFDAAANATLVPSGESAIDSG